MSIDPAEVSAWQTVLEHTYSTGSLSPVIVADGYALQVTVRNGQLNIIDGVGTHRRHRTIARADRTVKRLVILGRSGIVSLDALRWCNALEIGVSIIDGEDVTAATTPTPKDARLRRSQALAAQTAPGNRIAAHLIGSKITGQASLLADLGCDDDSRTLTGYAAHIARWDGHDRSMTLDRLREIEALCASLYFARYTKLVRVRFATREQSKVPTHWTSGVTRKSQLTNHGSPRKAADPLNALLNYSYALAESTIKQACLIVGLDPALGVMHTDKAHRDSMTLDILEPLRPTIDRHIRRLTDQRRFRRSDFLETPQGQCKLTETTTHYRLFTVDGVAQGGASIAG